MGWWNATADGQSLHHDDTGLVWGDGVADTLDTALDDIAEQFQNDLGRVPTKAELRAGLEFAISTLEEH